MQAWHATVTLYALHKRVSDEISLLNIIGDALDGVTDQSATHISLASLLEVLSSDLSTLAGTGVLNMAFPQDYANFSLLERLFDACDLVRTAGLEAGS